MSSGDERNDVDLVLGQLLAEHEELAELLDIMDREVAMLESGKSLRFDLLEDACKYLVNYPDVFHHPCEDDIARRMRGLAAADAGGIQYVVDEHGDLVDLSKSLYRLVECANAGQAVAREELLDSLREYCTKLRRHMTIEEDDFYPLARSRLEPSDWRVIHEALQKAHGDPLFGKPVEDEYRQLLRQIKEDAAVQ